MDKQQFFGGLFYVGLFLWFGSVGVQFIKDTWLNRGLIVTEWIAFFKAVWGAPVDVKGLLLMILGLLPYLVIEKDLLDRVI